MTQVANILLDLNSDSGANEHASSADSSTEYVAEEHVARPKQPVKRVKPNDALLSTDFLKLVGNSDNGANPAQIPPSIPISISIESPENKKTILLFDHCYPLSHLFGLCRNVKELKSRSDEYLLDLLHNADKRFFTIKELNPLLLKNDRDVHLEALILNELIEMGLLFNFNLLPTAKDLLQQDVPQAKKCEKLVNAIRKLNAKVEASPEWEMMLQRACTVLELTSDDFEKLKPMTSRIIHDAILSGKQHKVYVCALIGFALTNDFPELVLSKKMFSTDIAEKLFPDFQINRTSLFQSMALLKTEFVPVM
jgi:hypothetical protein